MTSVLKFPGMKGADDSVQQAVRQNVPNTPKVPVQQLAALSVEGSFQQAVGLNADTTPEIPVQQLVALSVEGSIQQAAGLNWTLVGMP